MLKKFLFCILLGATAAALASCEEKGPQIVDEGAAAREVRLGRLCEWSNANIVSLKKIRIAEERDDRVTGIAPIEQEGGTIGYAVTLTAEQPVIVYTMERQEGDGHTPFVWMRRDPEGVYCWTLDGEWLADGAGNRIAVPDADGITPQLKVEEGRWHISSDGGGSWTQLAEETDATESGQMIQVTQEGESVRFTLADGTQIDLRRKAGLSISAALRDGEGTLTPDIEEIVFRNVDFSDARPVRVEYTVHDIDPAKSCDVRVEPSSRGGCYKVSQQAAPTLTEEGLKGTFDLTATVPTDAFIPDDRLTITAVEKNGRTATYSIGLTMEPGLTGNTLVIRTPGSLDSLVDNSGAEFIDRLNAYGNMNSDDIGVINSRMPYLSVLDMKWVHMEDNELRGQFRKNRKLTDIELPQDLEIIGEGTFMGCRSLKRIPMSKRLRVIGKSAFNNCGATGMNEDLILPEGVTTIGEEAFYQCSDSGRLILPQNLKSIGDYAFKKTKFFGDLIIPGSVDSLGNGAFEDSRFKGELIFPGNISYCGTCPFSRSSLSRVRIMEGVTVITYRAFFRCLNLKEVIFPSTLKEIGKEAFWGGFQLPSITIPRVEGSETTHSEAACACSVWR